MVTTTSLNGDLEFRATQLFNSELEEDRQIAEMARQQLGNTVDKLVPVLVYVDQAIGGFKGAVVVKEAEKVLLVLDRAGKWNRTNENNKFQVDEQAWEHFLFSQIMEGLERLFNEATKKKEAHQAAVAKRRDLLNKIGAVIRGEAVPAAETK